MSLIDHPLWPELKKYVTAHPANDTKKARVRLEVKRNLPLELAAIQMPCVACNHPIHVVRDRHSDPKRGSHKGRKYIAVTCELLVSMGCSRGIKASIEYDKIKSSL